MLNLRTHARGSNAACRGWAQADKVLTKSKSLSGNVQSAMETISTKMRGDLFAHISQQPDNTFVGAWSVYMLRSAFQPIFSFQGGKLKMVAFEGLLRPSRQNQQIGPTEFFAKVPPEQRMHVETLSRTLHILNAGRFLDPAAMIFVNFDPSVFIDRQLTQIALRDLRLVLHEAGIAHTRVVCEMIEHPAQSEAALFEFVAELRDRGFKIAVDDFGSDDSDIRRIDELRPDIVKFDARWTLQLMRTGSGVGLLTTMVSKFRQMGIVTVFEGIEDGAQLELAERAGVDLVQGFALERPQLAPTQFAKDWRVETGSLPLHKPREFDGVGHPHPPAARSFGRRSA